MKRSEDDWMAMSNMHDAQTSHEIKKANSTLKTTKIKISAATVDREENSQ